MRYHGGMRLVPCHACGRHIRDTEASCPFCHADCPPKAGPARLAAALVLGLGLGGAGCFSGDDVSLYGPPPYDAAADAHGIAPDGGLLYGPPPPDAAKADAAPQPGPDASGVYLYGPPPLPDATP